jgi:hypothetical protein
MRFKPTQGPLRYTRQEQKNKEMRMKQLLQNMKTGKTTIEEVPVPTPRPGQALVKVAASLVSAGTERMVVEFAEKSLVGKARSRPDLVRQVVDKMKRDGVVTTIQAAFNRLDQPIPLGYSRRARSFPWAPGWRASRSVSAWPAPAVIMPCMPRTTSFRAACSHRCRMA